MGRRGRPRKKDPQRPTRAVEYIRVSTEEQARKDLSIPAQKDYLDAWAKREGMEIVDRYIDQGRSGRTDERDEFQRMRNDAREQRWKFEIILVYHNDRFSRNHEDLLRYTRELGENGVRIRYGNLDVDTTTPEGRGVLIMHSWFAEYYSLDLGRKTSLGLQKKISLGYHVGRPWPSRFFDYAEDSSRMTKRGRPSLRLVPKPELLEAKRLRAEGLSYGDIGLRFDASWYVVRDALLKLDQLPETKPD